MEHRVHLLYFSAPSLFPCVSCTVTLHSSISHSLTFLFSLSPSSLVCLSLCLSPSSTVCLSLCLSPSSTVSLSPSSSVCSSVSHLPLQSVSSLPLQFVVQISVPWLESLVSSIEHSFTSMFLMSLPVSFLHSSSCLSVCLSVLLTDWLSLFPSRSFWYICLGGRQGAVLPMPLDGSLWIRILRSVTLFPIYLITH